MKAPVPTNQELLSSERPLVPERAGSDPNLTAGHICAPFWCILERPQQWTETKQRHWTLEQTGSSLRALPEAVGPQVQSRGCWVQSRQALQVCSHLASLRLCMHWANSPTSRVHTGGERHSPVLYSKAVQSRDYIALDKKWLDLHSQTWNGSHSTTLCYRSNMRLECTVSSFCTKVSRKKIHRLSLHESHQRGGRTPRSANVGTQGGMEGWGSLWHLLCISGSQYKHVCPSENSMRNICKNWKKRRS